MISKVMCPAFERGATDRWPWRSPRAGSRPGKRDLRPTGRLGPLKMGSPTLPCGERFLRNLRRRNRHVPSVRPDPRYFKKNQLLSSLSYYRQLWGADTIGQAYTFSGLKFAKDFSSAELPGGRQIRFTRSEARALSLMGTGPGRLFSRDQLLDAVTQEGSDRNDRSIDFLINRLRRKLDDDARHPRFIETRYGEGYVWIGRSDLLDQELAGAYLVIGPLLGLENLSDRAGLAEEFAADLCSAAEAKLSLDQRVKLVPDLPPAGPNRDNFPRLSFGLTFFADNEDVHCIVTARYFATGQILTAQRFLLPDAGEKSRREMASEAAELLLDESWRLMATGTGLGVPLPVAMDVFAPGTPSDDGPSGVSDRDLLRKSLLHEERKLKVWMENERRLTHLRMAHPDDPILKVMYATHMHTRYVAFGQNMFRRGEDSRTQDEDEIERLTLEALPYVQSQPEYAIAAAKLLHFVDRGYFELARDLAENAYKASVSVSASLATIGQLRAFAGETAAALHCIDQALNLVEHGSRAHTYTLVLKCQALLAVRDYDRLQDAKQQLCANIPTAFVFAEPMFSDPDNLSLRARAVTMLLSRARARALLMNFHYISARLFRDPDHGANTIRTPVKLFAGRFGSSVVGEEIVLAFPWLLPTP